MPRSTEVKPETLRKKLLAAESLPEFLARMTLVWEERQRRLAVADEKHLAAVRKSIAKKRVVDPVGFNQAHREAQKRYVQRHPDRIKELQQRRKVRQYLIQEQQVQARS
jgi:hypothetical protein